MLTLNCNENANYQLSVKPELLFTVFCFTVSNQKRSSRQVRTCYHFLRNTPRYLPSEPSQNNISLNFLSKDIILKSLFAFSAFLRGNEIPRHVALHITGDMPDIPPISITKINSLMQLCSMIGKSYGHLSSMRIMLSPFLKLKSPSARDS